RAPLAAPAEQRAALDAFPLGGGPSGTGDFEADLAASGWDGLRPAPLEVFQINVGKLCNMTCRHCHVDAGPDRTEEDMDRATAEACVAALDRLLAHPEGHALHTVDLTGGAPELNPHFAYLVEAAVARGLHVIDRCNLTILTTRRFAHLPGWLAARGVEVACSLPHYRALNTDAQRGDGTYQKSIAAPRALNAAGHGPGGCRPGAARAAASPAPTAAERPPARSRAHGVTPDRPIAINNIPTTRYPEWLTEQRQPAAYMAPLLAAFNPAAVAGLMSRNTISV